MEGRSVAIIGVGSKVGRACAELVAGQGADVLAVDTSAEVAGAVAEDIIGVGGSAEPLEAPIFTAEGADITADRCRSLWGRLDGMVYCGSGKDWWPWAEDSVERWEEMLQANTVAPLAYTMALRPLLKESDAGSIVYLGSIDGLSGNPNLPSYSVSKAALGGLTRIMAKLCGAEGTRVNCIAAAAIDLSGTGAEENQRGDTSDAAERLRLTPLGRHSTADDMAKVALFFVSSMSSYVSGTTLPVDGGRIAITPGTILD